MTSEELAAIKALADGATPGPWEYDADCGYVEIHGSGVEFKPDWTRSVHNLTVRPLLLARVHNNATEGNDGIGYDGAFIAAARTAVPALLAEVERLRALVREAWMEALNNPEMGEWIITAAGHDANVAAWEKSDARKALGDA